MSDSRPGKISRSMGNDPGVAGPGLSRRALVRNGFLGLGLVASGHWLVGCRQHDYPTGSSAGLQPQIPALGPLQANADANDLRLPEGFASRVIATSGSKPFAGSDYVWHRNPDGAAVFRAAEGGWIMASNAENNFGFGGVGAIRFSASGEVIDSYSILSGTSRNCAGGPTPWGTWLSCEEVSRGRVYECDPAGVEAAVGYPGMGLFNHEAAAVDPATNLIYQTEDRSDGGFYRFRPSNPALGGRPDLGSGTLEIAIVQDLPAVLAGGSSAVSWATIPRPAPSSSQTSTRKQVAGATRFYRGEGAWYANGLIYFATTGRSSQPWQQRIWAYEVATDSLSLVYDRDTFGPGGVLTKPDNLTISPGGDVVVAEDGGDMQIVAITPAGNLVPLVQVVGHNGSEIAGPVFDPSGTRLYFSSQRGPDTDPDDRGITYEVTGPFFA